MITKKTSLSLSSLSSLELEYVVSVSYPHPSITIGINVIQYRLGLIVIESYRLGRVDYLANVKSNCNGIVGSRPSPYISETLLC